MQLAIFTQIGRGCMLATHATLASTKEAPVARLNIQSLNSKPQQHFLGFVSIHFTLHSSEMLMENWPFVVLVVVPMRILVVC